MNICLPVLSLLRNLHFLNLLKQFQDLDNNFFWQCLENGRANSPQIIHNCQPEKSNLIFIVTPQKANCEWGSSVCVWEEPEVGEEEKEAAEWSDKFKQGNNFFSGRYAEPSQAMAS